MLLDGGLATLGDAEHQLQWMMMDLNMDLNRKMVAINYSYKTSMALFMLLDSLVLDC